MSKEYILGEINKTLNCSILPAIQEITYSEDTAHITGDLGVQVLTVRHDQGGHLTSANGDYSPIITGNNGEVYTGEIQYKQRLAYSGTNVEHIGEALPGTSEATASWRIKRLTYDGSNNVIAIDWADGVATFSKVWNDGVGTDYTTYTYS